MLKWTACLAFCVTVLVGCAGETETEESATSDATTETDAASTTEAADEDAPVVIDVRTKEEYDGGHVEGALLIPHDQIAEEIAARIDDRSQKIVVYCKAGGRAQKALETLKSLGYTDVTNLGSLEKAREALEK